jgi:hypothetical protein
MQDNEAFRAFFTLPPIQESGSTALTVPETPAPKHQTGDREVDAVLWLQDCVRTGHETLIEKALETVKKIKTPMKDLGQRYSDYLMREHGSALMAGFGSIGFGDLESQAKGAIARKQKQQAALSRFGTVEALFHDTPAEAACKKALHGLKRSKDLVYPYDVEKATVRFAKKPDLQPHTLADCIYGMTYWSELYRLRSPFDGCGDGPAYAQAHGDYCFAMLAKIAPRSKEEALAVLDYLEENVADGRPEAPAILRNLIGGGWDRPIGEKL